MRMHLQIRASIIYFQNSEHTHDSSPSVCITKYKTGGKDRYAYVCVCFIRIQLTTQRYQLQLNLNYMRMHLINYMHLGP